MQTMTGLTLARVVKIHQLDNSLDCQLLDDGLRYTGVPIMCQMMSTSSGSVDFHQPEGINWDNPSPKTRDILAVLGKLNDQPIVMGFLAHPVSQMLFDRKNFKVDRHASDVYTTITDDGEVELAHPGGSYIRFAENMEHEDLAGADFDGLWEITRNVGKKASLRVKIVMGGTPMVDLKFDASTGKAKLWARDDIEIESMTAIKLESPILTHNGVNIGGSHVHGGVTPGGADTDGPH